MKILITGSSGFIGSHVVREILAAGHQVLALSRSSSSAASLHLPDVERLNRDLSEDGTLNLEGLDIDVVVHLAASLSGSAEEQYRATIGGTENLLAAMRQAGIRRLIGISSIAVMDYAAAAPMSVIEEEIPLAGDDRDTGTYAAIKARDRKSVV